MPPELTWIDGQCYNQLLKLVGKNGMSLKEELQSDVKTAMREGDANKRDTLRMLLAAIKQVEKDDQIELDDAAVEKVVAKQAKQRKESIADAERAGRTDLVAQEQAELAIIEGYLPQMLGEDEIKAVAVQVIDAYFELKEDRAARAEVTPPQQGMSASP